MQVLTYVSMSTTETNGTKTIQSQHELRNIYFLSKVLGRIKMFKNAAM